MYPEISKVVIVGDGLVSWALSHQLSEMQGLITTSDDTAFGTIHVPAENGDTEEMTVEVFERGGYETLNLLRLYCSRAPCIYYHFQYELEDIFRIHWEIHERFMQADQQHCPIALVGMQMANEPLEVSVQEAANRAAELGATHLHVQARRFSQVMAPFAHLGHRHIQARKKPTTSGEATTVYGSGEQLVGHSPHHQYDHKQHRQFHVFEDSSDLLCWKASVAKPPDLFPARRRSALLKRFCSLPKPGLLDTPTYKAHSIVRRIPRHFQN
ncbi:hypothetical protein LTR41_011329 [Exophiala xenobiotica]|nr:hypothetical protein LTR41_011329 [Exophiala xenobiotica]KAK5550391.1 hypothetical protein LTR46_011601 [Exophiala xenobiotica]